MPVSIEEQNGKHCVVEPDGSIVKCHAKRDDAVAHMRAMNANTGKEAGFFVHKDADGIWRWLGVFSNNWRDRHEEWLSGKGLRRFVEMVDSGEYGERLLNSGLSDIPMFKEIGSRGTPDLWAWHIPVPVGETEWVAYDKRGYLLAAGKQKEGEFYDLVFEDVSQMNPSKLGMSHGMANEFISRDNSDDRVYLEFLSHELTFLPLKEAANLGTGFGVSSKEKAMEIHEDKEKWLRENFSSEVVAGFEQRLDDLEFAAIENEVPRKEKTMKEKDQATDEVAEEEEEVTEELEETEVTEETTEVQEVAEVEEEEEEEEDEAEELETGMIMDPDGFAVPTDMREFAKEMIAGMKQVFDGINVKLKGVADANTQLLEKVDNLEGQLKELEENEQDRFAKKAAETPIASMSSWMFSQLGTAVGSEEAKLDYNKDRKEYKQADEDEEKVTRPGVPSVIAGFTSRQQSGNAIPTFFNQGRFSNALQNGRDE